MKIKIFSLGGTIDKTYFDKKSTYQVGEPKVVEILASMNVSFEYEYESLMRKDSLDMTEEDRELLLERIRSDPHLRILVTHGTDTMIESAAKLDSIRDKVVVFTGAFWPAGFKSSDAEFNVGSAVAALQSLPKGIYIAINGRVFHPDRVRKNQELNRFEDA
jgi:L-asparaginase